MLRNTKEELSIQKLVGTYLPGVTSIKAKTNSILVQDSQTHLAGLVDELTSQSVPTPIAEQVANLHYIFYSLDIIRVAENTQKDVMVDVAQTYFALESDLDLHWLRHSVHELETSDVWQRKAKSGMGDEVDSSLRTLTQEVIQSCNTIDEPMARLEQWRETNHDSLKHYQTTFSEVKTREHN